MGLVLRQDLEPWGWLPKKCQRNTEAAPAASYPESSRRVTPAMFSLVKRGIDIYIFSYYLAKLINEQLFLWQGLSSGNAFSIFTSLSRQSVLCPCIAVSCCIPVLCVRFQTSVSPALRAQPLTLRFPVEREFAGALASSLPASHSCFFLSCFFSHLHPFFPPSLLQLFVFSFL